MRTLLLLFAIQLIFYNCQAQIDLFDFTINGDAKPLGDLCYELTPDIDWKGGSIWSANQIDLNQSFVVEANLFLGCNNAGADGILFALQQLSTNIGATGGELGFGGIVPSLGVEFDTYRNTNFDDPAYDHIAIIKDGSVDHNTTNTLTGPVQASTTTPDIEDCQQHNVRIEWDDNSQTISVYFNCLLRLSYQVNLVNTVFNGDSKVFWGFTAATGSLSNIQRVCFLVPPTFNVESNLQLCEGETLQLHNLEQPEGFTFSWSPTDYLLNPMDFNTSANPLSTTTYTLSLINNCNESKDYNFTVEVDDCDCNGVFGGNSLIDNCGECLQPTDPNFNQNCADCEGVANGTAEIDDCGECLQPSDPNFNQNCIDCAGVLNGNAIIDNCGECLEPSDPNFNQSCIDCAGILNGNAEIDNCGECLEPSDPNFNQSCIDCAGILFGTAITDTCGVCIQPTDPEINQSCIKSIFVPNAFSPNGDGINDVFQVYVKSEFSNFDLSIYNRWGEKVFYADNITETWDGGTQAQSVYVYYVVIEFFDNGSFVKKGNVTLLR